MTHEEIKKSARGAGNTNERNALYTHIIKET